MRGGSIIEELVLSWGLPRFFLMPWGVIITIFNYLYLRFVMLLCFGIFIILEGWCVEFCYYCINMVVELPCYFTNVLGFGYFQLSYNLLLLVEHALCSHSFFAPTNNMAYQLTFTQLQICWIKCWVHIRE